MAKSGPSIKIFSSPHDVKLFFLEKSPKHNNVAPKINAWGQKFGGRAIV